MDRRLALVFCEQEIAAAVKRLAGELDRDYRHRPPALVGVLKGSFIFLADLVRQMDTPVRSIEFLRLASYGEGTTSPGKARVVVGLPPEAVSGQDIVLVEDIVDTGVTTAAALRYLRRYRPASIKVCALLDKPSRRRVPVCISYLGLTVSDRFVVGYGLDLDQAYRQLPRIYAVEGEPGEGTCFPSSCGPGLGDQGWFRDRP